MQTLTQNRLSTGLKVNSAIDNPSSFYAAAALNNRASDLSTLLDAMSTGVQTLKAAQQSLNTAAKFIEQAKSTARQAMEGIILKENISMETLKRQGIDTSNVVRSKAELLNKMSSAAAGDTIIVSGTINMGDESLIMKDGVTVAGIEYLLEENGLDGLYKTNTPSTINFNRTTDAIGIRVGNNTTLSHLNINVASDYTGEDGGAIFADNKKGITLNNVNLSVKSNRSNNQLSYYGVIFNKNKSEITINGNVNISAQGGSIAGIRQTMYGQDAYLTVNEGALLNIETTGQSSSGIMHGVLYNKGIVNIQTQGTISHGIDAMKDISYSSGTMKVKTSGAHSRGLKNGNFELRGTARLILDIAGNNESYNIEVSLKVHAGAIIGYKKDDAYITNQAVSENTINSSSDMENNPVYIPSAISAENIIQTIDSVIEQEEDNENHYIPTHYSTSYNQILNQYNTLLNDSGYQGINLLDNNDLLINFNEDRSSSLLIKGSRPDTGNLGIISADWKNQDDIAASIEELDNATQRIRSLEQKFGTYYNIVSTREKLTNRLIDILTEGADKLTLADMNEESSHMLALQTRQQLAVNALSLASGASQAILKLF